MDKIEEILPRISEFLLNDLAREKLSTVAEATRLFYVERIKALADCKEEKKNEIISSQIMQLRSLLAKKIGNDKQVDVPEKKNGYVKNESPANLHDPYESIPNINNSKINDECQEYKPENTEQISEYYDSEFDTSDDENDKSFPVKQSLERSAEQDFFSTASFKGEFFQNVLLKMRKRTCYIVGSEFIIYSKLKVRTRFSLVNCRTNVKQHDGKFAVEVRLEPAIYNLISLYTSDTQLAWRLVKAVKDAGGAMSGKDEKRNTLKDFDDQSISTQSSEIPDADKNEIVGDNLKSMVHNFFGTIGKKKGKMAKKVLAESYPHSEPLISGYLKLQNKEINSRWKQMFCYITEGNFYAKKESTDKSLEMIVPLKDAVIGLANKFSTYDLKIKVVQKETKFMIELNDVIEHGNWMKVLMKESESISQKSQETIYFENIGESSINETESNVFDRTGSDPTYLNHSEIIALMNPMNNEKKLKLPTPVPTLVESSSDVDNLSNPNTNDHSPTQVLVNNHIDQVCESTLDNDRDINYKINNTNNQNSDTKKAPPVPTKPNYSKRPANQKPDVVATTPNPTSTAEEEGGVIYSAINKPKKKKVPTATLR